MHPDDRVLVAVMSRPKDLVIARDQGWYRLPEERTPRGAAFEYIAFYFTAAFGDHAWAVHYYARRLGHELVTRRDLLPDEPDHPRAGARYLKLQLGPLQQRLPPIVSLRWRRISFIHTTWDRFEAAAEINDLFAEGGEFVDRFYHALREGGFNPERYYPVREAGLNYVVDLAVPCCAGVLALTAPGTETSPPGALSLPLTGPGPDLLNAVRAEVKRLGGVLPQRLSRAAGGASPR
ncbi:MAG TPA: hypothetical protein PKO09_08075 [Anaerolineae bacterium]|nr:hypothetical protein [Anaerolineae bacterium]